MTATLPDLLKSYREGGAFPSYDQLAAIADKDQIGAAVRGEAVADDLLKTWPDEIWLQGDEEVPGEFPGESETVTWCSCQQYGGDVHYIRADLAAKVSARAADAPSEPSEPLLTMDQVKAIRDTIKPSEGWDGDNWDFALANAVAASVKSRAADALDSQPTDDRRDDLIDRLRHQVDELNGRLFDLQTGGQSTIRPTTKQLIAQLHDDQKWTIAEQNAIAEFLTRFPNESSQGIISLGDAWKHGQAYERARASSQPTDGGVRNGSDLDAVHAFLMGESPLEGVQFGDKHPTKAGAFWWRLNLRAALAKG